VEQAPVLTHPLQLLRRRNKGTQQQRIEATNPIPTNAKQYLLRRKDFYFLLRLSKEETLNKYQKFDNKKYLRYL
jgi:hypothetical protein